MQIICSHLQPTDITVHATTHIYKLLPKCDMMRILTESYHAKKLTFHHSEQFSKARVGLASEQQLAPRDVTSPAKKNYEEN